MIREGKMKAYAFTSAARDPVLPNVSTMAEAGSASNDDQSE